MKDNNKDNMDNKNIKNTKKINSASDRNSSVRDADRMNRNKNTTLSELKVINKNNDETYIEICENIRNNKFDYQNIIGYESGLKLLYSGLDKLGITINKKQEEQLLAYYVMLVEKNKVMNLTGITDFEEVIVKHFIDSLALVKVVDRNKLNESLEVIDIGTGAGFPGIPLKILYPNLKITLLDSLAKRLKFLDEVIDVLQLQDIVTLHGRCEDLGKNKLYREAFDMCVSRAVANLSTLSEFCIPFVKVNGDFISYKAGNSNEEIDIAKYAIDKLGGKLLIIEEMNLPDSELSRVFVRIEKVKNTPKQFPRKAGTPLREPLNRNKN